MDWAEETDGFVDDAPETPAPLFAVRAFKHAIWGTPKADDNQEKDHRGQRKEVKAPGKNDGNSGAGGRNASGEDLFALDSLASPVRRPGGILLTPGTAGNRRKTVSFGGQARSGKNMESKRSSTNATPRVLQGGFPSPMEAKEKSRDTKEPVSSRPADASRRQEAKTTSTSSKPVISAPHSNQNQPDDATNELTNPSSASGRYWKSEYESYSAKSTQQMRKLVKKEQIAKKYAKHKDTEALKLADLLTREQRKVAELEKKLEEYVSKLSTAVTDASASAPGEEKGVSRRLQSVREGNETRALAKGSDAPELRLDGKRVQRESARNRAEQANTTAKNQDVPLVSEGKKGTISQAVRMAEEAKRPGDSSFDIWADAGQDAYAKPAEREEGKPPGRVSKREAHRSPLVQQEGNLEKDANTAQKGREVKTGDKENKSTMSDERREAAKKRLAERKKQRETGVPS